MSLAPPIDPGDGADLGRWRALAGRTADRGLGAFVAAAPDDPLAGPLLRAAFAYSPHLSDALLREPSTLRAFVEDGPEETLARLMAAQAEAPLRDRQRFMADLRRTKRRLSLLVALADLGGLWDLDAVTGALSAFADLACGQALTQALIEAAARDELTLPDPPEACGVAVLAMGKHGAHELNYSSDVDLVVFFEPAHFAGNRDAPMALATRLTRSLTHLLEQRTGEGYVFRTDLRLRPHPPGHPLTLPFDDAELYYERHGQNWERAAFIKARAAAGDIGLGETFLKNLAPFVWRKHLDFAAIRDIHSIKRQINAHRGLSGIKVAGHDLKLGRGGIREIEFFVQTQQLILGGRHNDLRHRRTLDTLEALAAGRWIDRDTAEDLAEAYRTLRTLEHRLQMVADKQTHTMPEREADLERFARFAGFADAEALGPVLLVTLRRVEHHYAALFENQPDLGAGRRLVFTGTDDDPGTLDALRDAGFKNPGTVSGRIRDWHHGHINATRSERARELLTELIPGLLGGFERQPDPDAAFALFDAFVSALPGGVQIFSLLRANPRLLAFLSDVFGAAPGLARTLAADPALFEAMLAPDFLDPLPKTDALEAELRRRLADAHGVEEALDVCRRWAHGRQFQAALHLILGRSTAGAMQAWLSGLAEIVVRTLLPEVVCWLANEHGRIAGGFVVLGLGKLGSRELTIGSDLDLVFVFEAPEGATSDGAKPLAAPIYFARLGQRLVVALSARTAEGGLYEIDTRLRPSGNAGPVACSGDNFRRYNVENAQTWERQALTRARVIAGDAALAGAVEAAVEATIVRPADLAGLARDVRAMRLRIFKEHGSDNPWSLKHARGGLVEIEFIAQYLQLGYARAFPSLRRTRTAETLAAAGKAGLLSAETAAQLVETLRLHHALQAVLRLSGLKRFEPGKAPEGLRQALVRAVNRELDLSVPEGHLGAIEAMLREGQAAARAAFEALCPPNEGKNA